MEMALAIFTLHKIYGMLIQGIMLQSRRLPMGLDKFGLMVFKILLDQEARHTGLIIQLIGKLEEVQEILAQILLQNGWMVKSTRREYLLQVDLVIGF